MPKYSVPITRKIEDVFIVEARNGSEAAFKVAELIAEGVEPDRQMCTERKVGTARPLIDDTEVAPSVGP
jgi:hypothetical protein